MSKSKVKDVKEEVRDAQDEAQDEVQEEVQEDETYEDDVDVDVDDGEEPDQQKDDDDEEDDDDDDTTERVISKKRAHVYHQVPESTQITIVAPEKRITSEYMTSYEYSMVVGTRATHITEGSVIYTNPQGLFDAREIAKKEINENKCPLSITRKISPTMIEVWEVNEMIKPQL